MCIAATRSLCLPQPEHGNIEEIRAKIRSVNLFTRDILTANVTRAGFVPALYEIFATAEDLESTENLHAIFDVRALA